VRKLYHAAPVPQTWRAAKAYVAGLAETGRPKITGTHEKFEITFDNGGFTLKRRSAQFWRGLIRMRFEAA
jgi:hypothetical protein